MSTVWGFFGSLVLVLAGIAWLLVKLLAYLRKSDTRYRWFEVFTCMFLIGWGFLLIQAPPDVRSVWWAVAAGGSIFAGSSNLAVVLLAKFWRRKNLRCSFCNKSQRDVKLLIAGPKIFICDECVDICVTIIAEHKVKEAAQEKPVTEPTE